jgi:hypothetical protein
MKYYVMSCEGVSPATSIGKSPALPGGPWMTGQMLGTTPPVPMVFELNPNYPGLLKAMYKNKYPLVREDLLRCWQEAGVDNLQLFPAILRDTVKGVDHTNYFAFNVIGVVSCADMGQSRMMGTTDSTMIDADFQALVIDEAKTGGALMFRLAESVNALVVHERVRKHIEANAIPNLVFYGPGEWAG